MAPGPPPYVLGEDSFAVILVDLALAESAASINVLGVRGSQIDSVYAFNVLQEHNVSRARYDSTLRYYVRHPELYKAAYQKALTMLSEMESARKGLKADSATKE